MKKLFFFSFILFQTFYTSNVFSQKPELVVQMGHTKGVFSVAFSPDSKCILSGSWDGTLKLWNLNAGKEIRTFSGHTSLVSSVAFSPDGKFVLSGSNDNTLKLWDIETGKEIRTFLGHTYAVSSVAFSPDGKFALSGSYDNTLKLWDMNSGKEVRSFSGHTDWITSVVFSPDGKFALSGSYDNTLKLWEIETGKEVKTFSGHFGAVNSVAYSPGGKLVLSGSNDNTLRLWEIETGKEIRTFSGHIFFVYNVAFSPDGKFALSGSQDGTLKLWDIETGKVARTFSGHTNYVYTVSFSPDGKFALSGSEDKTLKLWEIETGKVVRTYSGHTNYIYSVAFSPDGKFALSGSKDNTLRLWDIKTGREVRTFSGHTNYVNSVVFSPNGNYALSGSNDKTLKLWDIETGKEIRTFSGHTDWVYSVSFSPDGKFALSGGYDRTLKLWDIKSGQELKTFSGHSYWVESVTFSPDGKFALSGSRDNTLILWDINSGKEIRTFSGHTRSVTSVAFSSNGKFILSGSSDYTIKLWELNSGKEVKTFLGHTYGITSVAFSTNNKFALSGSYDKTLKLWDIETGKEVKTFSGHTNDVTSVAFLPDSKYILSGSIDNKMKLWNVETGKELCSMISLDSTDWAVVTPDGHFDASPGGMKLMHWVVEFETIDLEQLKERYYEPELLTKLMGFNPELLREVKRFNDVKLFPEIKVTLPSKDNKYLTINLTDRGGGIGKVKVLINSKELTADARGVDDDFKPDEKYVNLKVDISKSPYLIPGTDNKIEIFAYNAEEFLSSGSTEIHYTPDGTLATETPNFYGIIVGISNYEGDKLRLRYSSKDADDIGKALKIGAGKLFGENNTNIKIINTEQNNSEQPNKQNIIKAFESLQNIKQNDVLVVYLSGHGINLGSGTENEDFYYLTKEARTGNLEDPEIRKMTSISSKEMTDLMLKIPALKQVLILDVCGSGKVVDKLSEKRDIPSSQIRAFERMKDRTGLNILSGCASDAVSYEVSKYAQGLLTYSLLMGMKGGAVKEDGLIDVNRLFRFSEDEVPKLAFNIGGIQQPKIFGSASFDIGLILGEDKKLIPLSTAKPLILQSRFQDANRFIDHLGIEKKVNELLMQSSIASRDTKMVYIEASEFPDAYTIIGQYTINNNIINLNAKIFKGQEEKNGFIVTGETNKIDELIKKIIEETEIAILK